MKFLVIQTAFIGDVILATPIIEAIASAHPQAQLDFLLRKGNEGLLKNHPKLNHVYVWDKSKKRPDLRRIRKAIRAERYDHVINLQRFASMGWLTFMSGGKTKAGFNKSPFAFAFDQKTDHQIAPGTHEVDRNLRLIEYLDVKGDRRPKLYVDHEMDAVKEYKSTPYICIAPAAVWHTKQFPTEQWIKLVQRMGKNHMIYLLGGKDDAAVCDRIEKVCANQKVETLAGRLNLLQSAALMQDAQMNYVNDSAPMHLCSAVNAPITAVFCSTVPDFGFGPLSDNSNVVEVAEKLDCRPCGLHGLSDCPKGHFNCANEIDVSQIPIPSA